MAVLGGPTRLLIAGLALALGITPSLAVFGGKAPRADDPLARSVAAILYRDDKGSHLCTAVALGPRLLLTAGHCTGGNRGDIKVIFGPTLTNVGDDRIRSVAAIARAKKTSAGKGKFAYQDPDDLALVLLAAPAPAGARFVALAPRAAASAVTIVGYGATSELRQPNGWGQHQLGFDGVLRVAAISLSKTDQNLLIADQSRGAGACTGDSGGPAFVGDAVAGILVGVSSPRANNDYCRGSAWYANLARWHDWITTTAHDLGQPLD